MRTRTKQWSARLLTAAIAATIGVAVSQALAADPAGEEQHAAAAQSSIGAQGRLISRVKTTRGVATVIKSTTYTTVTGVRLATQNDKNQMIRVRFSASTTCRPMNAAAVGKVCFIRFLIDGHSTSVNPFTYGRAPFSGTGSMEDWRVFFDESGSHRITIQARTTSADAWFYLNDWTATIERVDHAAKL
jgi:hypothetical protein